MLRQKIFRKGKNQVSTLNYLLVDDKKYGPHEIQFIGQQKWIYDGNTIEIGWK
jgi:hypothetical protein